VSDSPLYTYAEQVYPSIASGDKELVLKALMVAFRNVLPALSQQWEYDRYEALGIPWSSHPSQD